MKNGMEWNKAHDVERMTKTGTMEHGGQQHINLCVCRCSDRCRRCGIDLRAPPRHCAGRVSEHFGRPKREINQRKQRAFTESKIEP